MELSKLTNIIIHWIETSGLRLAIGLIGLWIGWKFVNRFLKTLNALLKNKNFDHTLISFLDGLANFGLKILLILVFMGYVNISTAGLAAIFASAGLAAGLALQGSLSNFAGGVIILLLRPFKVSDYIETSGYQGTVEKISIFYTHLLTVDNKEIFIPNGSLSNGSLINYTSKPLRRVDLTFGVGYDDDILKVKRTLLEIVENNSSILKDPAPFISVSEHAASSVNFVVRVWCKTEDYWKVHFDLLEKVKLRFDEENISIPYPQMDIHMNSKNEI